MFECTFCNKKSRAEKLPEGWGTAKGKVGEKEFDITFCPDHRQEAEGKLDLVFTK